VQPSPALRRTFEFGTHACLAHGWDVVGAEELRLDEGAWARLADRRWEGGGVWGRVSGMRARRAVSGLLPPQPWLERARVL